jgi:hypothetical protein
MCVCLRCKKKENVAIAVHIPIVTPKLSKTELLENLMDKYVNLVCFFNKNNIFLSTSNYKFSDLIFFESKIMSITPETSYHKRLLKEFYSYKKKIDLLIYPNGIPESRKTEHTKLNSIIRVVSKPPLIFEVDRTPKITQTIIQNNDSGILIENN